MNCPSNKVCFRSHDAAMRAARRQMSKHRGMMLRVYRCDECKSWHLTSMPQAKDWQTIRYLRMRHDVSWPNM